MVSWAETMTMPGAHILTLCLVSPSSFCPVPSPFCTRPKSRGIFHFPKAPGTSPVLSSLLQGAEAAAWPGWLSLCRGVRLTLISPLPTALGT